MTNNSISLKQGEAKTVTITMKNSAGQAVDLTGCTLFFGMKKLVGDKKSKVLQIFVIIRYKQGK